jgi:hypothetical protein
MSSGFSHVLFLLPALLEIIAVRAHVELAEPVHHLFAEQPFGALLHKPLGLAERLAVLTAVPVVAINAKAHGPSMQ